MSMLSALIGGQKRETGTTYHSVALYDAEMESPGERAAQACATVQAELGCDGSRAHYDIVLDDGVAILVRRRLLRRRAA